MSDSWQPQFVYAVCQRGAEQALKREVAAAWPDSRFAYSRPGFVTFKLAVPCPRPERFRLSTTFARAQGFSLGQVSADRLSEMVEQTWQSEAVTALMKSCLVQDLHVWQRDTALPGQGGFTPGPTLLAAEVEQALRIASPCDAITPHIALPRSPSRRNVWVLDVVLVEPNQWWIGCHHTQGRQEAWPGGIIPLELPEHAVSRAYLKMSEALRWSALPIARGEHCLELGCAPGGASQALLERGLHVTGVDPAAVDPVVLKHPRFCHVRKRATEVPVRLLRGIQWLAADINATPNYTLDAVESMVTAQGAAIRGLILILKLTDWKLTADIPRWIDRVRSWGYRDLRTRQLAHNRQEFCLVALRSRAQRRVRRQSGHRRRIDTAHASGPASAQPSTDI